MQHAHEDDQTKNDDERSDDPIENEPIKLRDGSIVDVEHAPVALLVYRVRTLKYMSKQCLQNQIDAARELQRRLAIGAVAVDSRTHAAINRIVSPPCHLCHRKGIYIVGRLTYCSTHKVDAMRHLADAASWRFARRNREMNNIEHDREDYLKRVDRLRRLKNSRR